MSASAQLQRALECIKGTTWAVVYSFQAADDRRARWYDRWRYDIINDYVEAVSLLGCEPLICDADLYAHPGRQYVRCPQCVAHAQHAYIRAHLSPKASSS